MTVTFLLRFALAALISLVIAAVIASRPAVGATLLPDVAVEADVVTLGDLFDGAGGLSDRPVFRSPDPGVEGALPAAAAIAAARKAGLDVDPTAVTSVRVVRSAVILDVDSFRALIVGAIVERTGAPADEIAVEFDAAPPTVAADGGVAAPARVDSYAEQTSTGRFRAVVAIDVGAEMRSMQIDGTTFRTVPVPVLNRPIARGETISPEDVSIARRDRRLVDAATISTADALVGMAARRPLRAGEPILPASIEPPRVVRRGDLVTLTYEAPGLTLSARGRALADAAVGETVAVLNEQSRRTVEGIAEGPDKVRVLPAARRITAVASADPIE